MRATVLALTITAATFSMPALADWEYTHWGMTPEQVADASSGMVKVLPKAERTRINDGEIAAQGQFASGGRTMDVGFQFNAAGGLECVLYNALGDDVAPLKAELIRKYGAVEQYASDGWYSLTWKKPERIELTVGEKPLAAVVTHCKAGT